MLSGSLSATGLVGTSSFQVSGGNSTNPTYYIASAPISADSVYTGTVSSTDDANAYLLFDTETNASGTVFYPFNGDSVFKPDVQIPEINASISGGELSSVTATYHTATFSSSKTKFGDAPEIVFYDADFNESAEVTAAITSGQITSFSIDNNGSGYQSAPEVKVIAGPHFVKISDNNNPYNGRVFLITDNNKTRLNIDRSRLANGESTNISTYFPDGTQIEIIPAATLGSLSGLSYTKSRQIGQLGSQVVLIGYTFGMCFMEDIAPTFSLAKHMSPTGMVRGGIQKTAHLLESSIIPSFILTKHLL